MCDTTLEEFLEELDALTDPEAEESKVSPEPNSLSASEEAAGSTAPASDPGEDSAAQRKTEASSPRSSEKRVRFSEEPCLAKRNANPQARSVSSLKASKQGPRPSGEGAQRDGAVAHDQEGSVPPDLPVAEHQPSDTERARTDSSDRSAAPRSASPDRACGPSAKCSISNTNTGVTSGRSSLSFPHGGVRFDVAFLLPKQNC